MTTDSRCAYMCLIYSLSLLSIIKGYFLWIGIDSEVQQVKF